MNGMTTEMHQMHSPYVDILSSIGLFLSSNFQFLVILGLQFLSSWMFDFQILIEYNLSLVSIEMLVTNKLEFVIIKTPIQGIIGPT